MKIMVNSISPKDFYCVYNDFNVASKSQELNLLYLPLIGSDAVKLYQFLGTKILGDRNLSKNFLHYDIFDNLSLDSRKFTSSRKKLEALGLLATYYIDNDGVGQYVYKLKDALTFNEFFENAMLSQLLENTIGSSQYTEIKETFSNNKVSFNSFQDLTATFSDVYNLENVNNIYLNTQVFDNKKGANLDEYYFDFSKLSYFLANSYIVDILDNKKTKEDILGLAHLYKVTPQDMAKAIENSLDVENGGSVLNINKLKDYLVQLFVNVRKQNIPTLDKMITRKIEEDSVELTEQDKFIKATDNTNYIDYLNKKMNLIISTVDAEAINKLQKKYNFPTGVLNILLEYSIKMSNSPGIPNFNYMDKIASTWSSKKLLGAKDAIEYVKERQTISNNRKTNSKQVKSTNSKNKGMYMAPFPEYLQKRKDTSSTENTTKNRTVTKEDEEAFSEMLKELNSKRDI